MNRVDTPPADALIVSATADGVTDVSTAIQAVLDAIPSTGGKVWIPPIGTYLAKNLSPKANTTLIVPPSATLKLPNASGNAAIISIASGRSNVVIAGGGTLDGNKANNASNEKGMVEIAGDYALVSGMVLQNGSYGVRSFGGDYARILHNVVTGQLLMGIYVGIASAVSNYWLIEGNTVIHGGTYAGIRGDGVTGFRPQGTRIIANDVEMTATEAGNIGIEVWGFCERFVVALNTVRGGYTGVSIDNSPDTVVNGNTVYNPISTGIELAAASVNCSVEGNTIDMNGNAASAAVGCSNTGNAKSGIKNNEIRRFNGKGIHILSGTDYAVEGNDFFDGDGDCIYLQNCTRVSVRNGIVSGVTGNKRFVVSDQTSDFSVKGTQAYDLTTFVHLSAPSSALDNVEITDNPLYSVTNVMTTAASGGGSLGSNIAIRNTGPTDYRDHTGTIIEMWGTGSPESVVTAGVGSIFHRTDGGAGTCLYVKESGAATNTGWVGK